MANVVGPASSSPAFSAARSVGERDGQHAPAPAGGAQDELDDLLVGEDLRARELVALVALRAALERRDHAVGGVLGPDGLGAGGAAAGQRHGGQQREPLQPRQPAVAGRVDERGGERGGGDLRLGDRARGERLRPVHPRGVVRRGAERHRPQQVLGAGALGRAQQPPGGEPVELLDRRAGLVALGAGEVDHGPHAAQRVAERGRVGEVARGQLDVHPLGPEPPRVAHQAAHGLAAADEPPQHRGAEQAGRSREQDHGRA